jgi:hypothetical protein
VTFCARQGGGGYSLGRSTESAHGIARRLPKS